MYLDEAPNQGSVAFLSNHSRMKIAMKIQASVLFLLLLATLSMAKKAKKPEAHKKSEDFDFFYFVQQWPGSYCDTKRGCCYPTTGKPAADFGIHGLWPNYNDGSYPSNCDPNSDFDQSAVEDLMGKLHQSWPTLACPSSSGSTFWAHEWDKHGTCSESVLDQHSYFAAALNLHKQANLLQALLNAGIKPDGQLYSLSKIKEAISDAVGFTPGIECNVDDNGNRQLYQIYLCVDTSGTQLIECPVFPKSKCSTSDIEFPPFGSTEESGNDEETVNDEL